VTLLRRALVEVCTVPVILVISVTVGSGAVFTGVYFVSRITVKGVHRVKRCHSNCGHIMISMLYRVRQHGVLCEAKR